MVATRTGSDSPPDPGISVHSHPRSGTHYLMALLNENFIHAPSFRDLDWGNSERTERGNILHALPEDCTPWFEKAAKHFYIWREFEAVAESILRIPGRFGIDRRLPVSEFARSKWSELYNRGLEWQWLVDGEIERGVTPGCGPPIPTPEMTTFDFWGSSCGLLEEIRRP